MRWIGKPELERKINEKLTDKEVWEIDQLLRMGTSFFNKLYPLFSVFSPALSELDTNLNLGRVRR